MARCRRRSTTPRRRVDGFIADPNDSLDWLFEVPRDGGSGYDAFREFFADVGAMAMGATTYEWVLDHEQLVERPREVARRGTATTPCWVFTHRAAARRSRTWTSGSSRATCARCTRRWSRRRARRTSGSSAAASSSARSPTRAPGRDLARHAAGLPRRGRAAPPARADLEARHARVCPQGRAAGRCSSTASRRRRRSDRPQRQARAADGRARVHRVRHREREPDGRTSRGCGS